MLNTKEPIPDTEKHVPDSEDSVLTAHGMLEEFFLHDSGIMVDPINELNLEYLQIATKRGFYFKPLVDIEITAIGGRMAVLGTYEIEILESYSDWGLLQETEPVILNKNLNTTKDSEFQYVEVDDNVLLHANHQYVLRYFSENHESVFDAVLPSHFQNSTTESYVHPQMIADIEIVMMYYSYFVEVDGEYEFDVYDGRINAGAHRDSALFLRGIPDFKYRVK